MRNALLAIDLQADFVQGGNAPVPNGMQVAAMIARHIRHFKTEYQFVVASRDYHEDPTDHLGVAFVPPIANLVREKLIQCVVSKGRHAGAYSAFDALDTRGHALLDVLKEERVDHIDVCGMATDYGVRLTALDARKNAFQVRVLVNLCAAVDEAHGLQALEEMKTAGCQVQAATAP